MKHNVTADLYAQRTQVQMGGLLDKVSDQHCQAHNLPKTIMGPYAICHQCAQEQHRQHERAMAQQQRAERRERARKNSGVPPRFATSTLNTLVQHQPAQTVSTVQQWAKAMRLNQWSSLVLAGTVGTGKSGIAATLVNELINHNKTARYALSSRLKLELENLSGKELLEAVQDLATYDLLVVDDIGANDEQGYKRGNPVLATSIQSLLMQRHEQGRPTIISYNVEIFPDFASLEQYLGPRLFDRLCNDNATLLTLNGLSKRGAV